MSVLITPNASVHASFLTAMKEFQAEGRGTEHDNSLVGEEIQEYGETWHDPAVFTEYLAWLNGQADPANVPEGWVPCRSLWWTDGEEYLGRITLRTPLPEKIRRQVGHVGYDVRPSARRRGHATAMLAALLPVAAEAGLTEVTIICAEDNLGSIGTIEANGGLLEATLHGRLHYLVPTRR
ncbi:hypothetical protein Afil01_34090 [Actinorhabdospora filicis]|uniref:N-acetyltransferase domain-containing protein n=1 Tax=Actinorhabdospora filicis TaxID=1785913 RepID=A0A9W6SMP7_9ACTN|nr:GNAT family N-acetyltransferase [Actinorhabdospora filicis]GLZ78602.1 hypothetical protein Afil01_34090 [Actinorhabdospora filicis]